MCAIFGLVCLKGSKISKTNVEGIISDLFTKSEAHGSDASGLAITSNAKIKVLKDKIPSTTFVKRAEYRSFIDEALNFSNNSIDRTLSIIGHCRFKTKGTFNNNDNNHPIVTDDTVGVHNGVIRNDDELFGRYAKGPNLRGSCLGIIRKARVDSEIIFRLFDYFININNSNNGRKYRASLLSTANVLTGSYACVAVHKRLPHVTWVFRNHNPASIRYYTDAGIIIISTNNRYIDYAAACRKLGDYRPISLGQDEAVAINAIDDTFMRFPIKQAYTRT